MATYARSLLRRTTLERADRGDADAVERWYDHVFGLRQPSSVPAHDAHQPRQLRSDIKWEGSACAYAHPRDEEGKDVSNVPHRPPPPDAEADAKDEADAEVDADGDGEDDSRDKDVVPSPTVWEWQNGAWVSVPRPRTMECGRFFAYDPVPVKQVQLLQWLLNTKPCALTEEFLRTELVPRLRRTHPVSLRTLNWLVVGYSREHPVRYLKHIPLLGGERIVVVHAEYNSWLSRWRRRHYDPFRRRHRIYFELDGVTHSTTVAQLHFFYMASIYGFLEYTAAHVHEIDAHYKASLVRGDPAAIEASKNNDEPVRKRKRKNAPERRRRTLVPKSKLRCGFVTTGDYKFRFADVSDEETPDAAAVPNDVE